MLQKVIIATIPLNLSFPDSIHSLHYTVVYSQRKDNVLYTNITKYDNRNNITPFIGYILYTLISLNGYVQPT